MKKLIFLFSIFTFHSVLSQHTMPVLMDTNVIKGEVVFTGIIDYSGTSIQNAMSDKFIYGGFIDESMKDASMSKHRQHNKLGLELNGEIDYRNYQIDKLFNGKYGYYIRGGYGGFASASYTDDLFGLIFYGNRRYNGDTAQFSGTEFTGISFQKLGFGLITKTLKSSLGINYYNISNYGDAFFRQGSLISDSAGSQVDLSLDARFQYTPGLKFNKGWGIGLDGDFRFKASWIKERTAFFQAQFKNIGLMHINQVEQYQVDSSYSYSGLKFNQLYGENQLNFENQDELLDSLGVRKSTRSITGFLPGFVQIGKIVDEHAEQKVQSYFGVRMYTTLAYNPLIFGGAQYKPYSWMKIGVHAIYGGFAKFRMGFYTQYNYKNIHFGIGSENIIGALSKKGMGQSLHFRLAVQW